MLSSMVESSCLRLLAALRALQVNSSDDFKDKGSFGHSILS